MRISDLSSDVCSSDLQDVGQRFAARAGRISPFVTFGRGRRAPCMRQTWVEFTAIPGSRAMKSTTLASLLFTALLAAPIACAQDLSRYSDEGDSASASGRERAGQYG